MPAVLVPAKIGRYEVRGKLGQGAMGEVFRAHDPVLDRDVAVKRISAGLDADDTVRKRFEREARSAANLNHPNIITVYELGVEGDQLFMAMELLSGIDLKLALSQRKMTLDDKLDVTEQICEGLAFAHAHDVVHRDLKPANIHLLPGGKVKIMDFGLARMSGSDMTSTGTVMGTPHYMSPEQVRGARADSRSDVFSLGCVLYELLTGHKPFDAESMHAVLFKVLQEEPVPAPELVPGLPPVLVQVLEKALAKDPAQRFQSAADMLTALRRARQAAAAGRGHERAPDLDRTIAAPAARHPPRTVERAASSRSGSRPPASGGSHRGLVIGLAAALVVVAAGTWALRAWVLSSPTATPAPPGVASLAAAVIDAQVELARRKLDTGDYAEAARQAERALRLDPANADARAVADEAAAGLAELARALAALRQGGGPRAAFELMKVDPRNPEAEAAAATSGASFRPRAEEAQRLAAEARTAAEAAGASRGTAFTDAVALEKQGEQSLRTGEIVSAAQRFLEARTRFERAGRASR
jgi:tetratricopeptide (TPR) repeat protein